MSRLRFLPAIIVFFIILPLYTVTAQVPVEKSTEKIVVEGKVFYMHTVRKGQTVYSISKAYGTTEETIVKENPSASGGIREGQILKIPAVLTQATGVSQTQNKPLTQTQVNATTQAGKVTKGLVYHTVIQGETAYSLAKRYNVTVDDIARSNPGVNLNSIPIGTNLAIPAETPSSPTNLVQTQPAVQTQPNVLKQPEKAQQADDKFIYHRVSKGETLSSLSREYDISLRELKKANKGLLFPKEGEYVMIPRKSSQADLSQAEQSIALVEEIPQQKPEKIFEEQAPKENRTGKTLFTEFKGSVKVAVLLPFFLEENTLRTYTDSSRTDSKGQPAFKEVCQPGEWIYEPSVSFVEMYEGILLATDSLRKLGLDIELDVYDTGDDTIKIENLIASGKLRDADLILGPVYSSGLKKIAKYAAGFDIPVVSPVPLRDQNILNGNTSLFKMCPSPMIEQKIIAEEVSSIPDANVILVYSDSLMYDPNTISYKQELSDALSHGNETDSLTLRSFFFSGRIQRSNVYKEANDLESQLVNGKENIIVIATSESPKVSGVLSVLHNLSRRFNIRVIGSSEIRFLETIDLRYFYDLRMMIPIDSYIDYSRPEVNAFLRNYANRFKTEPNEDNFAWRGFDMAYFFIGGIAQYKNSFIRNVNRVHPQLLSYDLRFDSRNPDKGFENQNMFILQYNKDMTITVIPVE